MEEKRKADGLKEVAKEVIGWEDNKLVITLKHLTTQPGNAITAFCSGEKHKYLSPAVYYFGVEALKSYLISVSGLSDFLLKDQLRRITSSFKFSESLTNASADQLPNALSNFYT